MDSNEIRQAIEKGLAKKGWAQSELVELVKILYTHNGSASYNCKICSDFAGWIEMFGLSAMRIIKELDIVSELFPEYVKKPLGHTTPTKEEKITIEIKKVDRLEEEVNHPAHKGRGLRGQPHKSRSKWVRLAGATL